MSGTVQYEKKTSSNGTCIALLTMDHAPVNALSAGVRTGLDTHIKAAIADSEVKAVVIAGAHGSFCAGADISEFSSGMAGPPLPMVIDAIEACPKPVVAAIDGVSLGGGCEVSLGCHYRVASERSQAGLPEVNLGLLPGAGGTQRMPRLIGAESSIDFMCTGAPVKAAQAAKIGLFDKIVPGDNAAVMKVAIDFAADKVGTDIKPRQLSTFTAKPPADGVFDQKRKHYATMRKGENAPQAIITCIAAATDRAFGEGMNVEGSEFGQLFMGSQARAMQYMFFAERQSAKIPGLTEKPGALDAVGIVGAGLMGGGIAMCCAEAGMSVVLLDVDAGNLERGMSVIKKNYARSVKRGSKSQEQVDKILARIAPSTSYDDLKNADIVVEAVFENMKIKKEIFGSFDKVCKPGCILASNTSRLDIDDIASATSRPGDVVGCHFFSPANVMKLLENVRGPRTSLRTIATAMAFGKKIGKVTCLVGNCNGFVANRVMGVAGQGTLLQKGIMPDMIDAAAEGYGMKMGPFRMADLVGIDLFGRERANSGVAKPNELIGDALYAAGRYGQKNGKGFYKYADDLKATKDPDAQKIIETCWKNAGVTPQSMSDEEIVENVYLPVVNEGFKCLEEGHAIRPSDIDICCVFGYNWPRYHGGPMQWATAVGLQKVLTKIEALGFEPASLLKECVQNKWSLKSKEFNARVGSAWDARWSQPASKL